MVEKLDILRERLNEEEHQVLLLLDVVDTLSFRCGINREIPNCRHVFVVRIVVGIVAKHLRPVRILHVVDNGVNKIKQLDFGNADEGLQCLY